MFDKRRREDDGVIQVAYADGPRNTTQPILQNFFKGDRVVVQHKWHQLELVEPVGRYKRSFFEAVFILNNLPVPRS